MPATYSRVQANMDHINTEDGMYASFAAANSFKKKRSDFIQIDILKGETRNDPFAVRLHSQDIYGTRNLRNAINLREFGLDYKKEFDLPRKVEAGKLVPLVPEMGPGWWGICTDMNIVKFIENFQKLVEMDFFTHRFEFSFNTVRMSVQLGMRLMEAIRFKAGLLDLVDFQDEDDAESDTDN